jgi:3-keto-5-aminohexanoate cleavage enzyme
MEAIMTIRLEDISWDFSDHRQWREHVTRWPPVIISCAITGGIHGKEANPQLPTSPEEQADSTYEAYKAGASIVHIHARDPKTNYESQSSNPEDFYKINRLVRKRCPDIIINDTGGYALTIDDEEQMTKYFSVCNPEVSSLDIGMLFLRTRIKVRPEMVANIASKGLKYKVGEVMDFETVIPLGYSRTENLARAMRANNIKPELELFNTQGWWFVDNLIDKKLLDPPYWCQLVFGQDGACSPPTVMSAMEMINNMPAKSLFSAIGVGALQLPVNALSLIMGGHIRVGMEDNVYYRRGEKAKSNAQLVEKAVRLVHDLNREVATPAQAREMLGINLIPKQYP